MRKLFVLVLMTTALFGCKNDEKKETVEDPSIESSSESIVSGNFMYYADAAVFQTKSELFGVVENEMLEDLIIQSEPLKKEASDEVAVTLKVKKSKKPENEEGWENRIEILEILKVSMANPDDNQIIKLGKEQ